ncbi:MAG: orotate phosphoribosyltransferase [Christensenellales bacterium]|jgi:orotate phosphoribosyltransferase
MLDKEKAMDILKETGVMLEGHFLLTSGKHSGQYMQCAHLFEYPKYSEMFCSELARRFKDENIDVVVGPALGGIIMAYETARAAGCRNVFFERENGVMVLRRGFEIAKGERALVVEDVITTGGSVKEVIALIKEAGAEVIGVGAIVDRSGGKAQFGCRLEAVLETQIETYEAGDCPICKTGADLVKPGSRKQS